MHAFKLYTGKDKASHVLEGTLTLDRRTDVMAVHFKESPPHSALDWHDAPEIQGRRSWREPKADRMGLTLSTGRTLNAANAIRGAVLSSTIQS